MANLSCSTSTHKAKRAKGYLYHLLELSEYPFGRPLGVQRVGSQLQRPGPLKQCCRAQLIVTRAVTTRLCVAHSLQMKCFGSSRSAPFADSKTSRQNPTRASRVEARSLPAVSRTLNAEEAIVGELQKVVQILLLFAWLSRDVHHSSRWSVVNSQPKMVYPLAWDLRPKISLTRGRFTLLCFFLLYHALLIF